MGSTIGRWLPPDPEQMNTKRAQWAGEVLEFFEVYGERSIMNQPEMSSERLWSRIYLI